MLSTSVAEIKVIVVLHVLRATHGLDWSGSSSDDSDQIDSGTLIAIQTRKLLDHLIQSRIIGII